MKKVFDFAIGTFMVISIFAGIVLLIASFSGKQSDSFGNAYAGLACLLGAFSLYGFSVIVDAAFIYIENNKKKAEE